MKYINNKEKKKKKKKQDVLDLMVTSWLNHVMQIMSHGKVKDKTVM